MKFHILTLLTLLSMALSSFILTEDKAEIKFLVLTVATTENCEFRKFERSLKYNQIPYKVLGLNEKWLGYGWKLSLLKQELENYKDDKDQIILVTDGYDVLFSGGVNQIVAKFQKTDARILFSAESNCWPDDDVCARAPLTTGTKRYLNAGMYIGYAAEIYEALNCFPFDNEINDQLYFYRVYTNEEMRTRLRFKLDHRCELFQNFEGGPNNVELVVEGQHTRVLNQYYKTRPLLVHTPGYAQYLFYTLAAFLPKLWNSQQVEDILCIDDIESPKLEEHPRVLIALLTDLMKMKVEEFFSTVRALDYPKEQIYLYIRYKEKDRELVEDFNNTLGVEYGNTELVKYFKKSKQISLQDMGYDSYISQNCSYYWTYNSPSLLKEPKILKYLINKNRKAMELMSFGANNQSIRYMMFLERGAHTTNKIRITKNMDRLVLGRS